MEYPFTRLRRNRKAPWSREMIAETNLTASNLIQPFFIIEGVNEKESIATMPGIKRVSIDLLVEAAKKAHNLGIPAIALFPFLDKKLKSNLAEESYNDDNLMCRAIKAVKREVPEIGIMADVALDPYTVHCHDGIVIDGYVHNDETLKVILKQALSLANAGCDIIAPSEMMDGRIRAIRNLLEEKQFYNVQIMSYAAKYSSAFYGPFRDAVGTKQPDGSYLDKRSYQMDIRNSDEAMLEIELDIKEGADLIMIKPGLPYLDIIRRAKDNFNVPLVAFQVTGEYAMLKFATLNGALDYNKVMIESLTACKRAGASSIITYAAMEIAPHL